MRRQSWKVKFLIGIVLVLIYIVQSSFAGHKDDDDDDDDDDECYPGRNCRPGCYCTGSYCRPYFPPHSEYLKKYQCTGYNYPKWKVWKKGSKEENSTVTIIMAHHNDISDTGITTFLKENNFTTHDKYDLPVPVVKNSTIKLLSENTGDNVTSTSSILDLIHVTSSSTPPSP